MDTMTLVSRSDAAPSTDPLRSLKDETPDVETSSMDYALRFSGATGRWLLDVQAHSVLQALEGLEPGSVLDVGGGHGQLVSPLQQAGWDVTVHGTREECGRNLREVHGQHDCGFVVGDLSHLPAEDRSYDVVVAVRLLTHLDDWPGALEEMCRVARRAVIIDFPNIVSFNVLSPWLYGVKKSIEHNTRVFSVFRRRELTSCLHQHGFHSRREVKQFFLPVVLHRVAGAGMRAPETLFRVLGLTALLGSPVVLRADRKADR